MSTTETTTRTISKTVRIGAGDCGSVYAKIGFASGKLSITGVEGPMRNGDCKGSCGQIDMHEWNIKTYAPGWNAELEKQFREVWQKWHLNDMRAGCEHQREQRWNERPVYPDRPTKDYVQYPAVMGGGQGWNMLVWVPVEKGGLLSAPCGICGYRYGSQWLREEVPSDVLDFLKSLPDTDQQPAWI